MARTGDTYTRYSLSMTCLCGTLQLTCSCVSDNGGNSYLLHHGVVFLMHYLFANTTCMYNAWYFIITVVPLKCMYTYMQYMYVYGNSVKRCHYVLVIWYALSSSTTYSIVYYHSYLRCLWMVRIYSLFSPLWFWTIWLRVDLSV